MTPAARPYPLPLIAPTEAEWRAMTPESQLSFLVRVNDVLSEAAQMMGEGRRHKKAKTRTIDALNLHFRTIGRAVYLAEEMSVLYPGEAVFSPDVLAVLDVVEPDDDPRMAWVVADERRGLDFVLEVLHRGDRDKDLVDNVQRYARLGIPEYFVYDRLHQRIHGYRLPDASARRYRRIVPQLGHIGSAVLGLDMAIVGGKLRFFSGQAELPETIDLLDRLTGILTELEAKTEAAQTEQARAQAQAQAAQAEQAQAQARAEQALEALRQGITALLGARQIAGSDEIRTRLASCGDAAVLQRWLLRAMSASTAEEVFSA